MARPRWISDNGHGRCGWNRYRQSEIRRTRDLGQRRLDLRRLRPRAHRRHLVRGYLPVRVPVVLLAGPSAPIPHEPPRSAAPAPMDHGAEPDIEHTDHTGAMALHAGGACRIADEM